MVYCESHIPGSAHVLLVRYALADFKILVVARWAGRKQIGGRSCSLVVSQSHILPLVVPWAILKKYTSLPVVEHEEFNGRNHHIVAQTGWEEMADHSLKWVEAPQMYTMSKGHAQN